MPIVKSDTSLLLLCILVRALLTCIEPRDCEFGTCSVGTIRDEVATELRTNSLRVQETQ